jgi:hypothetical protein
MRMRFSAHTPTSSARNKNDTAEAEAICEAVRRPTMRFVQIKSAEQQGRLMLHRTRDLLMRQRTQVINALRAHQERRRIEIRLRKTTPHDTSVKAPAAPASLPVIPPVSTRRAAPKAAAVPVPPASSGSPAVRPAPRFFDAFRLY